LQYYPVLTPKRKEWRMRLAERVLELFNENEVMALCGDFDKNIEILKREYGIELIIRGGSIKIIGEEEKIDRCMNAINCLLTLFRSGKEIDELNVRYAISISEEGGGSEQLKELNDCICITQKGKPVRSKTLGQKKYISTIEKNTITIGVGPAGTGKTYLAVAMAVKAFRAGEVSRIVLTRPAVEAGEKLGFLPGDLQNKVDPYLRPLYDALFDFLGPENFLRQQERGAIEVAPLAYMRGRTLDEAFIILDEAQNTTREQMKMFLTRLGFGSKVIITGDITQIDLPDNKTSGLVEALKVLRNVDDIGIIRFTEKDVVRHKLVQDIIKAYDRYYEGGKKHE